MPQNTLRRTIPLEWDFLEPAQQPEWARTDHVKLKPASAAAFIQYPAGQVLMGKNDGSNEWAKYGTSGYGLTPRINKYPVTIDENGFMVYTRNATFVNDGNLDIFEGTIEAYYQGYFKTQDLISAGGTNEVQTETFDAGVDGGTRTLKVFGFTTAPIAWNALLGAIKSAILLACPFLTTADITVAGTGPWTYTFSGAYAGANVPLIVVDPALLTDGGVAPATTGSVIVETTPGAGLLTGVGHLIRGTSSSGIMMLGVGAPA